MTDTQEISAPDVAANAIERVSMTGHEWRAVGALALVAILRMLGLFMLLPVLALYAAGLARATPLTIGLAVGAYGLTQALLQIPFGMLSDRIGRLPVIVFGLLIFGAGSIIAGFSSSIEGVIFGRLLQGAGAISATLAALMADTTRAEVRTRSMAVFGIGIGMSFVVALIAGPLIAAFAGVQFLFWLAAAFAVVAIIVVLTTPQLRVKAVAESRGGRLSLALRPGLIRLDAYVFVLHVLLTASFVALPFVLQQQLEVPTTMHWQIYVGALLLSLIGTVPLILADERRGRNGTIAIALALLCVGQALLAIGGGVFWMVLLALSVFFAGFNFLEASLPARLSIAAPAEARGAAMGVFSSSQFLGAFAGGLLGGSLLAGGQPSLVFVGCALITAIWLALHGFTRGR